MAMDGGAQDLGALADTARTDAVYKDFAEALKTILPEERVLTDYLSRLVYGTDASFYRLTPEIVATVVDEGEVAQICALANEKNIALTFRAGGTSLSGQAVSDSVLVKLAQDGWRKTEIAEDGALVTFGPGLTGAQANARLARFRRKIGPDPASINAAQIGGIAANNASGMCCGVAKNSYHTVESLRLVMADGAVLDTADAESRAAFRQSHGALLTALADLAARVRADEKLRARIEKKFSIKNTTGYSLNALVDYEDPFDILTHLIIGSEGTLAFISEITYRTVDDPKHKATALAFFESVESACRAVAALKSAPVDAVELMDRPCLASVEDKPGMPAFVKDLGPGASALLIETLGESAEDLEARVAGVAAAITEPLVGELDFTRDAKKIGQLWGIRKGAFPSIGAVRKAGTTVIIEDVAVETARLAEAVVDLQALFAKHNYSEAVIFGHALEGNVHFVFTQGFDDPKEVQRYADFMDDVTDLITQKYDGSLKAEHSTGRNMAPFVELEWGAAATQLMREIKAAFDPNGILNPGVILNADPKAHIKNLKPMPPAHDRVDACIECGFCEPLCPSRAHTVTPRQRIVGLRELARRKDAGEPLDGLDKVYADRGIDACAGDSLCAGACPVGIDTGEMMRELRSEKMGWFSRWLARRVRRNFGLVVALSRAGLFFGHGARTLFGSGFLRAVTSWKRRRLGLPIPLWTAGMPEAANRFPIMPAPAEDAERVVYFPSCATRAMGPGGADPETRDTKDAMFSLLQKAGFEVVLPKAVGRHCCGQPFESKGLFEDASAMRDDLEEALWQASREGRDPIIFDTSPCVWRLRQKMGVRVKALDQTEAIHDLVLDRVDLTDVSEDVALHITCSARKMGLEEKMRGVMRRLGAKAVEPEGIECCGFAGDKGFFRPELNESALRTLKGQLPDSVKHGVSTSRTCEIGLTTHSGRPYRALADFVDRHAASKPKPKPEAEAAE